ncbi:hypothetical protein [Litoreibacter janthinus]|uniref:LTXXQ motif family protein n=1 Tax=Litoreibacter janthinus TaxID=670154 RepID=A0A1I6GR68_9RHOB|nr:hypothetical protein [Litoreibacter janthinus]SFR44581.1 hypothetical protein SAMN04488002_1861 [Litoreibacter janthinus]
MSITTSRTNRRGALAMLAAIAVFSHPAIAKTDEGRAGSILKPRYTQSAFSRLDKLTVQDLYGKRKFKVVVDGFSPAMSRTLINLAHNELRSTQRLVRDLGKIKNRNARINRITKEILKFQKLEQNLWKSVQRLEKKKGGLSRLTLASEKSRLNRTVFTIKYLRQWQASPMEGTR